MASPIHSFIREQKGCVLLSIKVVPRASRNEILAVQGSELKVRVTAPPVDKAANEAVLQLLAKNFGCHRNQLALIRGETSRHKVVKVIGKTSEELSECLQH